jgi:hypothetical protein
MNKHFMIFSILCASATISLYSNPLTAEQAHKAGIIGNLAKIAAQYPGDVDTTRTNTASSKIRNLRFRSKKQNRAAATVARDERARNLLEQGYYAGSKFYNHAADIPGERKQ